MAFDRWLAAALPFAVLAGFIALVAETGTFLGGESKPPPLEHLTVERVVIDRDGFTFDVRADGREALRIAQVMVDSAFWMFTQTPAGDIARGARASITVGFPWVENDTHHVRFVTSTGVTIDHTIDVARATPRPSTSTLLRYTVLGVCVGIVPVAIGVLFFPLLRRSGPPVVMFVLALTVGLLAYLLFDMTLEGVAFAARASSVFGGPALVAVPALASLAILATTGSGRHLGRDDPWRLALLIAFGIGLHNFGEGLAVGAALAASEIALGVFLVVGFALHNVSEGLGIVAPLTGVRASPLRFAGLVLVAGLPVVPGILIAAFSFSPHWAAVCFGVGAGAITHVVLEILRHLETTFGSGSRVAGVSVAGYGCGVAVMYATDLLIAV